jgi:hypothetical protein
MPWFGTVFNKTSVKPDAVSFASQYKIVKSNNHAIMFEFIKKLRYLLNVQQSKTQQD